MKEKLREHHAIKFECQFRRLINFRFHRFLGIFGVDRDLIEPVAGYKAGKLQCMRTLLALVLIAVMSLQAAAAAVGSYCQHDHDAVVKHVGHHDHHHKKTQQDGYAGTDLDCSMCQVGAIFGLPSELNLVTLSLPHADPVSVIVGHAPAPPFHRPERPNWARVL